MSIVATLGRRAACMATLVACALPLYAQDGGGGGGGGTTGALISWKQVVNPWAAFTGIEYNDLQTGPNGNLYLAGTKGVARSIDRGSTWVNINTGLPAGFAITCIGFNNIGEPMAGVGSFPTTSGIAYGYRYTSGSWRRAGGMTASYKVAAYQLDSSGRLLAITGFNGDVWRSTDAGTTFSRIATRVGALGSLLGIAKAPNGDLLVGGELTSGVWKSTTGGASWVSAGLASVSGYKGNVIVMAYNILGEPIVARTDLSGALLQRYSGGKWAASALGLPIWQRLTGLVLASSGKMYCSTLNTRDGSGAIYQSSDNGKSWVLVTSGYGNKGVLGLTIAPDGYLFVMTTGGQIWRTTTAVP